MTRVAKAIPNSTFFMISLALAFPGVEAKGSGCSSGKCGGGGLDKGSIVIIAVACVITVLIMGLLCWCLDGPFWGRGKRAPAVAGNVPPSNETTPADCERGEAKDGEGTNAYVVPLLHGDRASSVSGMDCAPSNPPLAYQTGGSGLQYDRRGRQSNVTSTLPTVAAATVAATFAC